MFVIVGIVLVIIDCFRNVPNDKYILCKCFLLLLLYCSTSKADFQQEHYTHYTRATQT